MSILHCVRLALQTLRVNKMRSILTMLGIIIGVSAVILMVAIMQGMQQRVKEQFQKLGSNLIIIAYMPNKQKDIGRKIDGFTMRDVRTLEKNCSLAANISPESDIPGQATAIYHGRSLDVSGKGVMPDYASMHNVRIESGRFLTDTDAQQWGQVCVIGPEIQQKLFGKTNPIGQELDVNGLLLEVVGVTVAKGRGFSGDMDTYVYIPITTLQKRLLGTDIVNSIDAQPVSLKEMNAAKDQIWHQLMRRYADVPGIKVDSMDVLLHSVESIFAVFTLVLGSIAGLAKLETTTSPG